MIMQFKEQLLSEISDKYGIKEKFLNLYFQNSPNILLVESYEEIHQNLELNKMYLDFAFSTINRGRIVRDMIFEEAIQLGINFFGQEKSYLDVGTAYGGFCIAFAEEGFDVTGVEINQYLYSLGVANLLDHNIKANMINDDFLKVNLESLGKFSIITCNDVIEHVDDPRLLVKRITQLLSHNGLAMFEIPNALSINHVTKDGHYNVFGINLLSHHSACQYLKEITQTEGYSCGEFYSLDWYVNLFKSLGLSVKLIPRHQICQIEDIPMMIFKLANQFTWSYQNELEKLSPFLKDELLDRYYSYMSDLYRDYRCSLATNNYECFIQKYCLSFWTILVGNW